MQGCKKERKTRGCGLETVQSFVWGITCRVIPLRARAWNPLTGWGGCNTEWRDRKDIENFPFLARNWPLLGVTPKWRIVVKECHMINKHLLWAATIRGS